MRRFLLRAMKLFQQLLVAPAALGLMATGVNAAELNINGVSDYAASADQVTASPNSPTSTPRPSIRLWLVWLRPTVASPVTPTAPSVATVP